MQRRKFLCVLGGAAITWSLDARAQQAQRMRRIGVLMNLAADDVEAQQRMTTFVQELKRLGWTEGDNTRIEVRWAAGDANRYHRYARELAGLSPDVMLAPTTALAAIMREATRTVPIVFVQVIDPVGAGLVESLARPGGNATGFMQFEYGMSVKLLELLKQAAPGVTRVAVIRNPVEVSGIGQFAAIQAVAPSLGAELRPIDARDAGEIERGIKAFGASANAGVVVPGSTLATFHRKAIVSLAARYKLPAIYSNQLFVKDGGLMSYGPHRVDQYRQAAGYVDRILKGEKPADLPVQAPTKYELAINLKTAKALGLTVPPGLLAIADEVIE